MVTSGAPGLQTRMACAGGCYGAGAANEFTREQARRGAATLILIRSSTGKRASHLFSERRRATSAR